MRKPVWSLLGSAVLAAILAVGCASKATVTAPVPEYDIVVAEDGSGDYDGLAAALEHAEAGDVIYVKPGTYYGGVEVGTNRLTIVGAGADRTIIDADDDYAALSVDADELEVTGVTLCGGSSHGIYIEDGDHRFHGCLIVDNDDRGIYFSSFSDEPGARIDHCTIANNAVSGIYAPVDNSDIEITNCIIAFNGRGIVSDEARGLMTIESNCVYEDDGDDGEFDRVTPGEGNITEDPLFVDPDDDDYRLEGASPCIGAASDGRNMGCF